MVNLEELVKGRVQASQGRQAVLISGRAEGLGPAAGVRRFILCPALWFLEGKEWAVRGEPDPPCLTSPWAPWLAAALASTRLFVKPPCLSFLLLEERARN